jgi:hypothetical protein
LLLQSIAVELRFFAFCRLPVPRMRCCLRTFFSVWGRIYRNAADEVASRVESRLRLPEDVSHYDYDAQVVAADGGAARIAEGDEW